MSFKVGLSPDLSNMDCVFLYLVSFIKLNLFNLKVFSFLHLCNISLLLEMTQRVEGVCCAAIICTLPWQKKIWQTWCFSRSIIFLCSLCCEIQETWNYATEWMPVITSISSIFGNRQNQWEEKTMQMAEREISFKWRLCWFLPVQGITLHLTFAPKALQCFKTFSSTEYYSAEPTRDCFRFRLKSHRRPQCTKKAGIQNPKLPGGRQWHSPPVESLAVSMGQLLWFSEHLSRGDCSSAREARRAGIWAALASQEPICSTSTAQAEFPGSVPGPCPVVRALTPLRRAWSYDFPSDRYASSSLNGTFLYGVILLTTLPSNSWHITLWGYQGNRVEN